MELLMKTQIRFYLWEENGPKRIGHRCLNRINDRTIALPRHAGTTQRFVEIQFEGTRVIKAFGSFWSFDGDGYLTDEHMRAAGEHVSMAWQARLDRHDASQQGSNVRQIGPELEIREMRQKTEWIPSDADRDQIHHDLMGPSRPNGAHPIPILKVRANPK
jgi:hypothetical protein